MKTRNRHSLSVSNVAVGLTVASVLVNLVAAHVNMPIDQRGMLAISRWHFTLVLLSWQLPFVALGA